MVLKCSHYSEDKNKHDILHVVKYYKAKCHTRLNKHLKYRNDLNITEILAHKRHSLEYLANLAVNLAYLSRSMSHKKLKIVWWMSQSNLNWNSTVLFPSYDCILEQCMEVMRSTWNCEIANDVNDALKMIFQIIMCLFAKYYAFSVSKLLMK